MRGRRRAVALGFQSLLPLPLPHEGNLPKAVEHFANAVRVHSDPTSLLRVFKENLPAEAFMLLLRTLQSTARA